MSVYGGENVYAPASGTSGGHAAAAPQSAQRLAGTGTTEASNSTSLNVGKYSTLVVGAAAVRVTFRPVTGTANAVATTDLIIGAYGRFDWLTSPETCFVYAEAADGSSAYEAWVWSS